MIRSRATFPSKSVPRRDLLTKEHRAFCQASAFPRRTRARRGLRSCPSVGLSRQSRPRGPAARSFRNRFFSLLNAATDASSRLKTKLTRRTLRGSSLCRGCLISHINHSFAKEMSRIISLLSALAAANAFAPVVRPATRAAVRVQVGVPRIDLPAQIVRITASDEPSLTHGCNGTVACSNEQFS